MLIGINSSGTYSPRNCMRDRNPPLMDEGVPSRPWEGAGDVQKNLFVSMDSLLSPSSHSSGSSIKSSSISPTTNIISPSRRRGVEAADEEIRAAAARAIHRLDNKSLHNYLPNEISVSDDDEEENSRKTPRRLFQSSSNEAEDVMDFSSFQSLPCNTSSRDFFPSEADRKRIVACLAITLASSYLYDDDENIDESKANDQPNIPSYSDQSFIPSNVLTTTEAMIFNNSVDLDSAESSSFTAFPHHRHLSPSTIRERKSTAEKSIKATRLRFSIELFHQCTHLLFLDPSHATALEPILYIRPTPTTIQQQDDVNKGTISNTTKSSSSASIPAAPTPQRQLPRTASNKTPRQGCLQTPPPSPPSMRAIISETLSCASEYDISSPPARLARYGLLTSPSYDVGPDNSDQTPCEMERVDEHPLQSNSLPSSLFCTFSRASTDAVLENSLHCQNYNYNNNNNTSHPEEESLELLQKIKEGLLSSSFEQQDALPVETNTQQEVWKGGEFLAQHQRQALDGFRELVLPFLSELTNQEVGYDCISLLLLHYLLANPTGYDARVRFIFKRFTVVVLIYTSTTPMDIAEATNRFEAIERIVSQKITLVLSEAKQKKIENDSSLLSYTEENTHCPNNVDLPSPSVKRSVSSLQLSSSTSKEYDKTQLLRTLKITTASLAAGTVFALTGGLAAPGIAAGVAALTSSGTALLLPHGMLTTMFGVGGGGLIGYKVQRRTKGLTQFDYKRAVSLTHTNNRKQLKLHNVICLSGWIRDSHDFYRPWGIPAVLNDTVGNQQIISKDQQLNDGQRQFLDFSCHAYNLSSLIKFYDAFKPENVHRAAAILQHWEGEEHVLWRLLRERYGTDPFSFMERGSIDGSVNGSHIADIKSQYCKKRLSVLDILLEELGYSTARDDQKKGAIMKVRDLIDVSDHNPLPPQQEHAEALEDLNNSGVIHHSSTPQHCACSGGALFGYSSPSHERSSQDKSNTYDHPAWDFFSFYDGELYTVVWEENLLMELCDSVTDMALDIVEGQIVQILRQTALHSFMNAIALPFTLVNASNMIDETWTLTIERAEEAGKELAKSLLANQAGNKPVILLGYSMGARVIYSCLKELAKHQEKWESEFEAKKRIQADNDSRLLFPCRKTLSYSREPSSIVEDAVLMGCPNHISLESWRACRRVVAGRLINCYSRKDLILSLMFQMKRMTGIRIRQVCGTRPVNVHGVENYDVTHLISQHSDYSDRVQDILKLIGYGQPSPLSLPIPANYCDS